MITTIILDYALLVSEFSSLKQVSPILARQVYV